MMNKVIQIIFKTFLLSVLIAGQVNFSYAQTASILPPAKTTFLDNNGKPLVSGKVKFYIPGTTTAKTTWQDSGETIPNTNPVVLDGSGRAIILGDGSYRQQVFDRLGNLIWDQQTSSQGSGGGGTTPTVGDGDAVGMVKPWPGFIAPSQYVFAYGQALARASFPLLFATLTSQQNVGCTSGNPVLTGLSDTTQLAVGAVIESVCLNAGATVTSTTISTVTASSNAIISTTSSARFFPFGNGDGSLTFNVPDLRGRVLAGRDNMGSIAANRLTSAATGFGSTATLGATGGNQSETLAMTNLPASPAPVSQVFTSAAVTGGLSTLAVPVGSGVSNVTATGAVSVYSTAVFNGVNITTTAAANTANLGSGTAIPLIQPTEIANYIIKTLPDTNANSFFGVASIGGMTGIITCGFGVTCAAGQISAIASTVPPPTSTTLGGVLSATCLTSNWFRTLDTTGTFGCSQPNFTDLLGSVTTAQITNNAVTNAKLAQGGAATLKGNPTASLANDTDFTIQGLTNTAPNSTLDFIPFFNHTTGTIQSATPSQISSAVGSGVTSLGGLTGAITCGSGLTCSGSSIVATALASTNVYNVETFGAKADLIAWQDGAITTGTPTFNSANATFVSGDVGKIIAIAGAGTSGALLATTIATFVNSHQVTLSINAGTTVTAANWAYSTNSTTGIQAAANAAMTTGGDVQFNFAGQYGVTGGINLTNPTKPIRILGVGPLSWGTVLVAMSNANAIIDATGHDAIQIANITVASGWPNSTDIARPNVGILIAPSAAIHGVDVIRADNVRVVGFFGTAAWYMDRIYGATLTNISSFQYLDSASTGYVMTGTNIDGVSSAFTTTCTSACNGSIGSFTTIRSEFHNFGSTPFARPSMFLDAVVDSVWLGGLISGNGTTMTPSNTPTGLLFEGVQFSADNTTLSSVFGAGSLNFVTSINNNAGGVAYGGTITNFASLGRQ